MKKRNLEENCVEQMYRLFKTRLYPDKGLTADKPGLFRMDDYEMREDVQKEVVANWEKVTLENLEELADIEYYKKSFLNLFGFGFDDVNYEDDVDIDLNIPSME